VLGRPDLARHPEFATNIARVHNRELVDQAVAEVTGTLPVAELTRLLDAAGVPGARVNNTRGLAEHPQLAERDRWRAVDTPAGAIQAILPPIGFGDVEARMGAVPALGEHTATVLTELGLDPSEVAGLRERHIIG
jgi:formyl-CoA transferase